MKKNKGKKMAIVVLGFSLILGNTTSVAADNVIEQAQQEVSIHELPGAGRDDTKTPLLEALAPEIPSSEPPVSETTVPEASTQNPQEISKMVKLCPENFPDEVFREWLSVHYDEDNDGYLSEEEVKKCTMIDSSTDEAFRHMTDLTGIGHLTALTALRCENMGLQKLDVSRNKGLIELRCGDIPVTIPDTGTDKSDMSQEEVYDRKTAPEKAETVEQPAIVEAEPVMAVAAVPNLRQKALTTSSISLEWDKCPSVTAYVIYGYKYNAKTKTYSQHYDTRNVVKSTKAASFTQKKLKHGTRRRFLMIPYTTVNKKNQYGEKSNWVYTASLPGNASIETAKANKGTITVTLMEKSPGAEGYAYCYGKASKWSSSKDYTITAKGVKMPYTMKNIPNGTWYVRVRPYVKANGTTIYGAWSGSKKVEVKKTAVLKKHIGTQDLSYIQIGGLCGLCPEGTYEELGTDFLAVAGADKIALYDKKYRVMQAGCIDKAGEQLYYLIRNHYRTGGVKHEEWGKCALLRVSVRDWTVQVLADKLEMGHANDMTYYNGKLVVPHYRDSQEALTNSITVLNPENPEEAVTYGENQVVLKDKLKGIHGIAYNPSKKQFAAAMGTNGAMGSVIVFLKFDGRKFTETGKRFSLKKDAAAKEVLTTRYYQGIECSANGIYMAFSPRVSGEGNTNCLITYNWTGDFKQVTILEEDAELENLSRVYGTTKFYAGFCAVGSLPGMTRTGTRLRMFELSGYI